MTGKNRNIVQSVPKLEDLKTESSSFYLTKKVEKEGKKGKVIDYTNSNPYKTHKDPDSIMEHEIYRTVSFTQTEDGKFKKIASRSDPKTGEMEYFAKHPITKDSKKLPVTGFEINLVKCIRTSKDKSVRVVHTFLKPTTKGRGMLGDDVVATEVYVKPPQEQ